MLGYVPVIAWIRNLKVNHQNIQAFLIWLPQWPLPSKQEQRFQQPGIAMSSYLQIHTNLERIAVVQPRELRYVSAHMDE